MKKILFISLTFIFCSVSYGQWINQISGTTEHLNAIQFVNSTTGYCVGDNGTILKSTNSGLSWTSLNSNTTVLLNSLFFIDSNTGFVSGNYFDNTSNSQVGVLLKTIDGGINWINLNFPFEENLSDLFFINSTVGFASCLSNGLFKTVDGGINWNLVKSTNTQEVFFPSALIGYSIDNNTNGGAISKTIDGGLNWVQIKDGNSPDYNSANILRSLFLPQIIPVFLVAIIMVEFIQQQTEVRPLAIQALQQVQYIFHQLK